MLTFLLSLLILLFYAGCTVLVLYILFHFWSKFFGPVPANIQQIIYALVALAFCIWLVQSLVTATPVKAPWQWSQTTTRP